jgi:hypothetical protein
MANARCHDLNQNLTGLGAFEIDFDDFERGFGRKSNGGAGLHRKLRKRMNGSI